MLIALDYDETYTKDPAMWLSFIDLAKFHGHEVILATMRYPDELFSLDPKLVKALDMIIPTSRKAKRTFLASRDITPDVWIDDMPEWIVGDSR